MPESGLEMNLIGCLAMTIIPGARDTPGSTKRKKKDTKVMKMLNRAKTKNGPHGYTIMAHVVVNPSSTITLTISSPVPRWLSLLGNARRKPTTSRGQRRQGAVSSIALRGVAGPRRIFVSERFFPQQCNLRKGKKSLCREWAGS